MTLTNRVIEKPTTPQSTYVLLNNVSWEQLEQLDITLAGTGARLTYLDGILEIMSPLSDEHEDAKSTLSLLLEVYFREKRFVFISGEVQHLVKVKIKLAANQMSHII